MKVKELIDVLKGYDGDMDVRLSFGAGFFGDGYDVFTLEDALSVITVSAGKFRDGTGAVVLWPTGQFVHGTD